MNDLPKYYRVFADWRDSGRYSPALQAELKSMRRDSPAAVDRFYQHLQFGTAGLRGLLGAGINRMNEYTLARAATGYARYLVSLGEEAGRRGVAISYDSRRRSREFAEITARLLVAHGIRAYLSDELRPVPMLSFAVRHYQCVGGVMITASHNPKEYNGFKVYGEDGGQLPPEAAAQVAGYMDEIEDLPAALALATPLAEARQNSLWQELGKDLDEAYTKMILQLSLNRDAVARHEDLKIVFSPLHGAGNRPVRRALRRLGFQNVLVVPEQEEPDPDFSTVEVPNPEMTATLQLALDLAEREGADLVIATDPDGDRLGVAVRTKGAAFRVLTGNQIGLLLLDYILDSKQKKGSLPASSFAVTTVVSTRLARTVARHFGVQLYTTLTGFKFIAELIHDRDEFGSEHFQFGFEESFGYLAGTEVRDKDAVVASLLFCEMAAVSADCGQTIDDRLNQLFERYGHAAETTLQLTRSGKEGLDRIAGAMATLRQRLKEGLPGIEVHEAYDLKTGEHVVLQGEAGPDLALPESDVLIYELGDGDFVCVRPSGTEPKMKVYFGFYGPDPALLQERLARHRADLESYMTKLLDGTAPA